VRRAVTWYRVEFDADGKRVSCRVAYPADNQANVFYVQAVDDEVAWRRAQSLRVQALQRKNSAKRIADGKCPRCGVGAYDGTTRCAEYCKPEEAKRQRNDRAVVAAVVAPQSPPRELNPQLTRDERLRLEVLKECCAAWRSPRNFLTWISGEIDALTTKLKRAG